jgi:hypothetical protein
LSQKLGSQRKCKGRKREREIEIEKREGRETGEKEREIMDTLDVILIETLFSC